MKAALDNPRHFRFLELPKELRDVVYEHLMPQPESFALGPTLKLGVRPNKRPSEATTRYTISQTCPQIRQEALELFYSSTPFTFDFRWHKDIESARRWLHCQDEIAISSMRKVIFRHGSLNPEHHALIAIDLRKGNVSIQDNAFESCVEGEMLPLLVGKLGAVVDDLETVGSRKILTNAAFGRMLDALSMMFGARWPGAVPITLCHSLY